MTAKFWINNIYVADFTDRGDGSQPTFRFTIHPEAKPLFNVMKEKLEKLPEATIEGMQVKIDESLFIDLLHSAILENRKFTLLK
jgi:hypothetical protein